MILQQRNVRSTRLANGLRAQDSRMYATCHHQPLHPRILALPALALQQPIVTGDGDFDCASPCDCLGEVIEAGGKTVIPNEDDDHHAQRDVDQGFSDH